ncbi:P-loop ATPase, Sll1717 family [Streptomyces sp. NPDC057499]|uniref:P-loop ATPase, Sll1717 family n=1 Tax=Streptomyces sp. NPDC057499 TaxID=3346150 RepID=UPI003688A9BF
MDQRGGPVHHLFFGRDDAEHDYADGLLRQGFQQTLAYEAALAGRKSLVIGRKGSGKSAICAQLAHGRVYSGPTTQIAPDNAAGDVIRRFDLQGVTSDTAKSLIWRYLFAVQAARHLVRHSGEDHRGWFRIPPAARALRDFLHANGEDADARLTDLISRGAGRLQSAALSLKMFGVEASVQTGEAPAETRSEGARAMRQLDALETGVRSALTALECAEAGHPPLLVLVDQLELVWQADPDSHALVTGLLMAAKHAARMYGSAVRCVLFIRSDIYDTLNFSDKDKFRSDEMHIAWTPEALHDVALARARISLGRQLSDAALWGEIFPATVCGVLTPDYLTERCLPRPRDAIQYLTRCRDVASARGHATIHEADVLTATQQFSLLKLDDLAREYNVGFPFLRQVFVLFEYGSFRMRRDTFNERFAAVRDSLHDNFDDYTELLNEQSVLEVLFAIGFLGVGRDDEVVYAGTTVLPMQPGDDELHVHPCFRPALHCEGTGPASGLPGPGPSPDALVPSYSHTSFLRSVAATDVGFIPDREVRLLDEVRYAADRLLRHLDRSGLSADLRVQVRRDLESGLERRSRSAARVHVRTFASLLTEMSGRLEAAGYGREPVTLRLADEARTLERALGGSSSGGGGSDSSG